MGQGPPVVLVYDIFGPEYNQVQLEGARSEPVCG